MASLEGFHATRLLKGRKVHVCFPDYGLAVLLCDSLGRLITKLLVFLLCHINIPIKRKQPELMFSHIIFQLLQCISVDLGLAELDILGPLHAGMLKFILKGPVLLFLFAERIPFCFIFEALGLFGLLFSEFFCFLLWG